VPITVYEKKFKIDQNLFGALFGKVFLFYFIIPMVVVNFSQKISFKCKCGGGSRSESDRIGHY
jgi:hypothetical protein